MIIHDVKQGSIEWMLLRAGIATASEFDQLLTPEFKIRTGDMPKTYLAKKVAEAWLGGPLPTFRGGDMEQGQFLETEAIPWYELEFGVEVQRPGLITTDDKRSGCSPDGVIAGANCGLEIKCPEAHTHVRYLLSGNVPKDYLCQVHGGMYVTGFQSWVFLSYRRHFPALRIVVARDEEIQAQIAEAMEDFLVEFDFAMARMAELNGGPPRHRILAPMSSRPETQKPEFHSEMPS